MTAKFVLIHPEYYIGCERLETFLVHALTRVCTTTDGKLILLTNIDEDSARPLVDQSRYERRIQFRWLATSTTLSLQAKRQY